jgi:hypothetical protein
MQNFFQQSLREFICDMQTNKFINFYENHYDELTTPGSEVYEKVINDFSTWGWCQMDHATCAVARLIFLKINGKNELYFESDLFRIINTKKPVYRKDFDKLCEIAFDLIEKDRSYDNTDFKGK